MTKEKLAKLWSSRLENVTNSDKRKKFIERAKAAYESYLSSNGALISGDSEMQISENVYWKYVKDVTGAVYVKPPKIKVSRKFKDKDEVGRVASFLLLRNMKAVIEDGKSFHDTIKKVLRDRIITGIGWMMWRYCEETESIEPVHIEYSRVVVPLAPSWKTTDWVAIRHEITFNERVKRWGMDKALKSSEADKLYGEKDVEEAIRLREAEGHFPKIYQIFDKTNKKLIWFCKTSDCILEEEDYKVELSNYYPLPAPFLGDMDNANYYPVPDYFYYQDLLTQIQELDTRIRNLIGIAKLNYAFDSRFGETFDELMRGECGTGYSVSDWQGLAEAQDIQKGVVFTPLEKIISGIQGLQSVRSELLGRLRTITEGMVGGVSAGQYESAASIKAKESRSSSQLQQFKMDFNMYISDVLNVGADLLCETYDDLKIVKNATAEFGLNKSDAEAHLMNALALLKDQGVVDIRISVFPESMTLEDDAAKRKDSMELLNLMGQLLRMSKEVLVTNPETAPAILELAMYTVRQFSNSDQIEFAIEQLFTQALQAPKEPQTSPDVQMVQMQTQAQMQSKQLDVQLKQQQLQLEAQVKQQEMMLKKLELQLDALAAAGKLQNDANKGFAT